MLIGGKECAPGLEIVQKAETLKPRIQARELPADFVPGASGFVGAASYHAVLARVRHEFTNYLELLGQLPQCMLTADEHKDLRKVCPELGPGAECPYRKKAHNVLKWVANSAAKAAYDQWRRNQRNAPLTS